jgi:hypothetical protein
MDGVNLTSLMDGIKLTPIMDGINGNERHSLTDAINSLTAKSVPAGTKLILFGRYLLNICVGIVQYILCKMRTWHTKIYLPTLRTNWGILYDIN